MGDQNKKDELLDEWKKWKEDADDSLKVVKLWGNQKLDDDTKKKISDLLGESAIEPVEDACSDYLHFSATESSRGEINRKLSRLGELLRESLEILNDDAAKEAVSLIAFRMSPSKKLSQATNQISHISESLKGIAAPQGKGRPKGSGSKGVGRPAEILCDQICWICQQSGYQPETGLLKKAKTLLSLLHNHLGIGKGELSRKLNESVQRVRERSKAHI